MDSIEATVPTPTQFAEAFSSIHITDLQMLMLEAHYRAPGYTLTADQMARSVGYSHYAPANGQYGRLGNKLGNALQWRPTIESELGVSILATFSRPEANWLWHMRPEVVAALEELGWFMPVIMALPDEINDEAIYREGATKQISVNGYERNPMARKKCVEHYGFACVVCNSTIVEIYGRIGEQYIHVHHLRLISEIGTEYQVDPIEDLRPVCPNCHAMLHRKSPPFSIEELRKCITDRNY